MNDLTTLITYYGVGYTVRHAPKDNLGVYEDVEIIGVNGVEFNDHNDRDDFNGWFFDECTMVEFQHLIDEAQDDFQQHWTGFGINFYIEI